MVSVLEKVGERGERSKKLTWVPKRIIPSKLIKILKEYEEVKTKKITLKFP
jgi:hypothetical protein